MAAGFPVPEDERLPAILADLGDKRGSLAVEDIRQHVNVPVTDAMGYR
jgi:hypothetical protein